MHLISEELAKATANEVFDAGMASQQDIMRLGRDQRDLLGFVIQNTQPLEGEVFELAVYMFYVIYRMFENAAQNSIPTIPSTQLTQYFEDNQAALASVAGPQDSFLDEVTGRIEDSSQPFVMKYIINALREAAERDDDPVALSDSENQALFTVLTTTAEALDASTDGYA
jgi:hypothetical protein